MVERIINGDKYIASHLEMGIWQVLGPSGNPWTFANKEAALKHMTDLNNLLPVKEEK